MTPVHNSEHREADTVSVQNHSGQLDAGTSERPAPCAPCSGGSPSRPAVSAQGSGQRTTSPTWGPHPPPLQPAAPAGSPPPPSIARLPEALGEGGHEGGGREEAERVEIRKWVLPSSRSRVGRREKVTLQVNEFLVGTHYLEALHCTALANEFHLLSACGF